ncbi:hypothetical protein EVAR_65383_1 [Eumeta japonica]|uniref:Uncharacterized protein n=1 Tax=Eumeta variegata TaxID=151549 RepID=A0A4C1ZX76_EUMVA|nr:hypothetical protein EVAR_65383_1 [Eumeta japonica]
MTCLLSRSPYGPFLQTVPLIFLAPESRTRFCIFVRPTAFPSFRRRPEYASGRPRRRRRAPSARDRPAGAPASIRLGHCVGVAEASTTKFSED